MLPFCLIQSIALGLVLKLDELIYSFVEAMDFKAPWLFMRFFGGALFVLGLFLMAFNLYKTVRLPALHDAKHTVNEGA